MRDINYCIVLYCIVLQFYLHVYLFDATILVKNIVIDARKTLCVQCDCWIRRLNFRLHDEDEAGRRAATITGRSCRQSRERITGVNDECDSQAMTLRLAAAEL